jgi:hypothetical protein
LDDGGIAGEYFGVGLAIAGIAGVPSLELGLASRWSGREGTGYAMMLARGGSGARLARIVGARDDVGSRQIGSEDGAIVGFHQRRWRNDGGEDGGRHGLDCRVGVGLVWEMRRDDGGENRGGVADKGGTHARILRGGGATMVARMTVGLWTGLRGSRGRGQRHGEAVWTPTLASCRVVVDLTFKFSHGPQPPHIAANHTFSNLPRTPLRPLINIIWFKLKDNLTIKKGTYLMQTKPFVQPYKLLI